jgi:hypothetical protein
MPPPTTTVTPTPPPPTPKATPAGWRVIPALLLLGLGGGAAFLCWQETSVVTTSDAILWLADPTHGTWENQEFSATDETSSEPQAEPSPLAQESGAELLEVARAELVEYIASLEAARQAIEDAVIMVREQKENFDFAEDRYATLMPLVETGALEPLAASQIQSAYISARASLAQAKFLLSQARRDFGTEQGRRMRLRQLQNRVVQLENGVLPPTLPPNSDLPPGAMASAPPHFEPFVVAYFPASALARTLQPGQTATLRSPAWGRRTVAATVTTIEPINNSSDQTGLRVRLRLTDELPAISKDRTVVPVRVRVVF